MANTQTLDCFQPGVGKLERVAYFNRMLLTAEDMRTDQDFVLQKLRRHNRFLHGWGVVCGLIVKASPTAAQPWRVQIGSGYALGPFGDEIFVGQAVFMDLQKCGPGAATNPCEPSLLRDPVDAAGPEIYLGIKYAECRSRPVLATTAGCGCEDDACEYSRIRDSFSIECLGELPASHIPADLPSVCDILTGKALLECPVCPTDPWVVLARITLPASAATKIADATIDNTPPIRRIVISTALLQAQIIECCCGGEDGPEQPPPPREADLRLRKSGDSREGPDRGTVAVAFNITVDNPSATVDAQDIVVEDRLSSNGFDLRDLFDRNLAKVTNFKSHFLSAPGIELLAWTDIDPMDLVARVATLKHNDSLALSFDVIIPLQALRASGDVVNTATVKSTTDDPNPGNNSDRAAVHVQRPG